MDEARIQSLIETIQKEIEAQKKMAPQKPPAQPVAPAEKRQPTSGPSQPSAPPLAHPVPAVSQAAAVSQAEETKSTPAPLQKEKPAEAKSTADINIDLPDPMLPENRYRPGIGHPCNPEALEGLIASTTARIGVGRAGPRYRTASLLLFQADHAVTQDALMRDVDPRLLEELGLFTVQTQVTGGKSEYLLRPDLGRKLDEAARRTIAEKCVKNPNIQICVGDGLSAAAIEANLRQIYPVIQQGVQAAKLSLGTPFFIRYCRVGVLNDIGDLLKPDVAVLLIGERPGLGRAESMSAYMAFRPKAGDSDAERDVICNIFENGGTNPLEAGAVLVQQAQKMIQHQVSGVKLKLAAR